ncbi:MAG TPA: hypothetical protein VK972_09215, partial [Wenzhouxiangella sp.]|nr:hypothetical protein [Wenzhouxiangella sp.]
MRPEAVRTDLPGGLTIEPAAAVDASALFEFALARPRPGAVGCGLEWLGGDLPDESWRTGGEVSAGQIGDVVWRRSGELLFLALEQPEDPSS